MKKVKIISDRCYYHLEDDVNNFLRDHNVVDLQYRINGKGVHKAAYSVMIVYEED